MAKKAKDELKLPEPTDLGSPLTWADLKEMKKARTGVVKLTLDTQKRKDVIEAMTEARNAKSNQALLPDEASAKMRKDAQAAVDAADEKVELANAELERVSVPFHLRAIGRKRLQDLVEAHPPTPQQYLEHRKIARQAGETGKEVGTLPFDPDEVQPRLIAACLTSPVLSDAEAKEMWSDDDWSEGECGLLFQSAWMLCETPE